MVIIQITKKNESLTKASLLYEGHPESKERLRIQSAHLFCCSRSLVSGVQCDVEKLPHAIERGILSRVKSRYNCGYYSVQSLVNSSQMIKT